jgi:hypothetical protein
MRFFLYRPKMILMQGYPEGKEGGKGGVEEKGGGKGDAGRVRYYCFSEVSFCIRFVDFEQQWLAISGWLTPSLVTSTDSTRGEPSFSLDRIITIQWL